MEVQEMLNVQKNCLKRAKKIVARIYRTYDRIWVQRIRVTSELEATGLITAINARMPNLLLRREDDTPDIGQTARVYGFADGAALALYLSRYESRRQKEEAIYQRLAEKAFAGLPGDEYQAATVTFPATLSAIVSRCKRMAKELTQEAYQKYDDVWYGRMRISPELLSHGKDVVAEINAKLPNFLVHDPASEPVDRIADSYGFDSESDLIDWLLAYEPRGPSQAAMAEKLMREELGLGVPRALDEVPF